MGIHKGSSQYSWNLLKSKAIKLLGFFSFSFFFFSFYHSAGRQTYTRAVWLKFIPTLEQSTQQQSFAGTHVLCGTASSIRMTLGTVITNMPARPGAHMLWTVRAGGHWEGTPTDVQWHGGIAHLLTPSLLFYCNNYLACKAFVQAWHRPSYKGVVLCLVAFHTDDWHQWQEEWFLCGSPHSYFSYPSSASNLLA